MAETRYVFDNAATAETGLRFAGLEATFDPSTISYLTGVGVTYGWACWEIGAGGGSIARWLAERVGPTGSVLATDIDPGSSRPPSWGISRWPVTTSAPMRSRWLATISSTPGWS
jgi:hypothetical protein